MLNYLHRKAIEVKDGIIGTVVLLRYRREHKAIWEEMAKLSEETDAEYNRIHGQPNLPEHDVYRETIDELL